MVVAKMSSREVFIFCKISSLIALNSAVRDAVVEAEFDQCALYVNQAACVVLEVLDVLLTLLALAAQLRK